MQFPDYWTSIGQQFVAFMSWTTVTQLVAVVIGVAIGTVVLGMFLKVVLR